MAARPSLIVCSSTGEKSNKQTTLRRERLLTTNKKRLLEWNAAYKDRMTELDMAMFATTNQT